MGSIPAGLNLNIGNSQLKLFKDLTNKKETFTKKKVSYTFYSLFSPSSLKNLSLYFNNAVSYNISNNMDANYRSKKVLIKQSYLLLAWLGIVARRYDKKAKQASFSSLPKKTTKFTMTKAPMAHKTFSQEQFVIQYKRLSINLLLDSTCAYSLIMTLMSITNFHLNNLSIGTNLFFLSRVIFTVSSQDAKYFTLKCLYDEIGRRARLKTLSRMGFWFESRYR